MIQNFSSMLAVLLVVLAGVTILVMLEMNSRAENEGEEQKKRSCLLARRTVGYLFLALFAFVLVHMVTKAGGLQEKLSAKAVFYVILSLLLLPLLLIKVVIARRQAQVSTRLILLGIAIFTLSFGLAGVVIVGDEPKETAEGGIELPKTGQTLMSRKCSKCHSLERVYQQAYKDNLAWTETVSKMMNLDYPNITSSDAQQIVEYLTWLQEKRHLTETGRHLVAKKCGICHELARVFGADKNAEEWAGTVGKMSEIIGDPDFLSEQERKDIISFLSRKQNNRESTSGGGGEEEAAAALVSAKCSAGCHDLSRILDVKKTPAEWAATVNSMVDITGNPDYLNEREKKEIIEFLSSRSRKQSGGGGEKEKGRARPKSSGADHPLISSKCGVCHDLERVYQVGKTEKALQETISSMVERTGDPDYLSEQEKKEIVTIISNWEEEGQ
jgi:mono/diheme cytochrome c family protein